MTINFKEARRIVESQLDDELGGTSSEGREDAEHYAVPLEHEPLDDSVWIVTKAEGLADRVPIWDISEKLDNMQQVFDTDVNLT